MHPRWKTKDEFPGSISLPYGVKTSHTWHEIGAILRVINDYDVMTFVELGFHVGGLGTIVSGRSKWMPNFQYMGYDLEFANVDSMVARLLSVRQGNIFENIDEIYSLAKDNGKVLIYCDNGDKAREMREFSKHLQSGDIIMCHDYYDGQEVVGLEDFGDGDGCGCVPEVIVDDIQFLLDDRTFDIVPEELLYGTRIIGFIKK